MKKIKKILIIIQRSNGDVFLSSSLIKELYKYYETPHIDLLVNDDTYSIAKQIPYVKKIHLFSYQDKKDKKWLQEKNILLKIYKKYDLSINLTASDRSVFYALIAGKKSISAIEIDKKKSWWKKIFLSNYYYFDCSDHILYNNLKSLDVLKIKYDLVHECHTSSKEIISKMRGKLSELGIKRFIIFHPSAQYNYKIYPKYLRDRLLIFLNTLGVPIVITGSGNKIDISIKQELPLLPNLYDFINETTLEEYFALSKLSLSYIGMDTLNMHIAAAQNKRIFAIFGPTNLNMWAPWSNQLRLSATLDKPIQTYGNITIFQSALPCVSCGNAGCDNKKGRSECLHNIHPEKIFNKINEWYKDA